MEMVLITVVEALMVEMVVQVLAVVEVFTALLVAEDFTVTVAAMEAHRVEHHLEMVEPEEPEKKITILVQEWADLAEAELVS
jgi:hypothetical protein